MRILYDYQAFSRQHYGGVSRYFVELARHLPQRTDTSVRVAAPFYINHYLPELPASSVSGRHVAQSPKSFGRILNLYNRQRMQAEIKMFEPDIFHETYFGSAVGADKYIRARVLTVYDMIHELFPQYFSSWDNTARNKKNAVARADHVICISETTRRDMIDILGVPPEKVSVTHLGFTSSEKTSHQLPPPISEDYLLYVGVRSGYKNFNALLRAYASSETLHDGYRLVCFGGGKFSAAEQSQLRKHGLTDRIVWFGGNDSVLSSLYAGAAAFVCTSLYEGFGIPPLEAMSFNCPVVCSTGGSISEVVDFAGEFFDPHDESDIVSAIERVTTSQQRGDELRVLGQRRLKDFSWQKCATETHAIYSALL